MDAIWTSLLIIYLAGLGAGLFLIDEPFPARVGVAAAWPVGPIAFAAVVAVLLAVLPIALPRAAVVLAALVALVWWIWSRGG